MNKGNVVIFGGAGFVGSHIIDELVNDNYGEIICVDNLIGTQGSTRNIDSYISSGRIRFFRSDMGEWLENSANLNLTESLSKEWYVINQVASKNTVSNRDPELDLYVNAASVIKMMKFAQQINAIGIVHASSGSVYGEAVTKQNESHRIRPESYYGVSKFAGESYVHMLGRRWGIPTTILRYFHVIGPRQFDGEGGGVASIFVKNALAGKHLDIYGDGSQVRHFTDVRDVARANLHFLQKNTADHLIFNCCNKSKVTVLELAQFIKNKISRDIEINFSESRVGDIRNFHVDNSKICKSGATFKYDWEESVDNIINWYRKKNT